MIVYLKIAIALLVMAASRNCWQAPARRESGRGRSSGGQRPGEYDRASSSKTPMRHGGDDGRSFTFNPIDTL